MGEEQAPAEPIAAPVLNKDVPEEKVASDPPAAPSREDHTVADDSKALVVIEEEKRLAEEKKEAVVEPAPEKSGSINRDAVLAKVNEEKRAALVKAWEENEVAKADNKYHKALTNIIAWENTKKSSTETKLRKAEEKLEKKKADYIEKMKNEIATIHRKAEEKKAMVEAKRGEEFLKAEEMGAKYRAEGHLPKKFLLCFSA
ncbi:remorin [Cryptomeria japonica]|uniref:remorin n=1 Tax=Cryptomeria japonica TaxID=3369 RepID=UPI0025AD6F90|nr:remorin [Cryptomeria japonica]XP_057851111.1 remorin [Cryptomeria japonica]XP_057851112.1 remorin [Cryptomeria japonica]XP_057851114.1 remorin [Cryptomeria japonica]XP_057851115.1 remorin [Cryptomeria japonica]XP_057851116.1 remorin [Cryptomeria japonica]